MGDQAYDIEPLGAADDLSDADGVAIISYWQAQTKARERMVSRAHAAAGKAGPLTVGDAIEAYLSFLETNRKSAVDSRTRANAFIIPALGDLECEALTTEQIHKWHVALAKQPPRARTKRGAKQQHRKTAGDDEALRRRRASANRVMTILKAALNRAWRAGKVASDAAWRRVEPFANVDAARVRYLTVAEAKRLINACNPELRPLVQAALQTGARYGELARLQVQDFNRDAGTLAIRLSKSGKARHIVLTDEGVALFGELAAGRAGHELMLRKSAGEPWGASHQWKPMRQAYQRAKITPPISFHALRHTWASLAVMARMPLMIVARNLGHADTRMVEKHYGYLAPSYVADTIRAHAPKFGFTPDKRIVALTGR
jgi:integrase